MRGEGMEKQGVEEEEEKLGEGEEEKLIDDREEDIPQEVLVREEREKYKHLDIEKLGTVEQMESSVIS